MILNFPDKQSAITASRQSAMGVQVADGRILCRALGRWAVYTDCRDRSIMPALTIHGIWQPALTELLCEYVKPGMVCVDAGATFGYFSLLMSELVGPTGRVFAFEPNPRVHLMLKHTLEENGYCPRALAYKDALGDVDGKAMLFQHKTRYNSATLAPKAKASFGGGKGDEKEVPIVRMESRLNTPPDFCMIDAVGWEPQVISGMGKLLQAQRHITLLVRYSPVWYDEPDAFVNTMFDEGFIIKRVHDNGQVEPLNSPEQFHGKVQMQLLLTR